MKKIIPVVLAVLIVISNLTALAYEYPNGFWGVYTKYEEALNSNDYLNIIKYGEETINLMDYAPGGPEKTKVMISRLDAVGNAYAKIGQYDKSAMMYRRLCQYAGEDDPEFGGTVKGAKARITQYESSIQMYVDGGTNIHYGATNEKVNGVLFGVCSDGETRSKLGNESLILTYQELGYNLIAHNRDVMKQASKTGVAVEFALNCPKQSTDIDRITRYDSYLEELSDLFDEYYDVPVYLRFAAEFNSWDNIADPEAYKYAFRYVADHFHRNNRNVAMVWSPTVGSNWYVSRDDYYPGDSYVDWVGVSLYPSKYFEGNRYSDEFDEIYYKSGVNSDPVIAVRDIVETYGNRKPIMVSESGVGHTLASTGEKMTDFALQRLREMMYYLPIVYPQIKVMAYFDNYAGDVYDFRLSTNPTIQNEYLKITRGGRFIQDQFYSETDLIYRPASDGMYVDGVFEVACYAHKYKKDIKQVTYSIDGRYAGVAFAVPYTNHIDAANYSGYHTLKAVVEFTDGETMSTESEIYIMPSNDIKVEISDRRISFEQDPIMYNDRVMVPLRKIFEELGAKVTWDGETKTATGIKGDRTVKVTIGQNKMYVNNKEYSLDTPPIIIDANTLVPVRAVSEGMGCTVEWDGNRNLVSVTPKVFKWSEWMETLPGGIDEDLYYIESQKEYSYRTREKFYYTTSRKEYGGNYVRTNTSYGNWSGWSTDYVRESDDVEVETRTQYEPERYLFAHYCTGYISDKDDRYCTANWRWHSECDYHELGWFDYMLSATPDGKGGYVYYKGDEYLRCGNSCYRWYVLDTEGGNYTEYRYRNVYREYVYWEWDYWTRWSDWDTDNPYDYYWDDDTDIDVETRYVYRYKEK